MAVWQALDDRILGKEADTQRQRGENEESSFHNYLFLKKIRIYLKNFCNVAFR